MKKTQSMVLSIFISTFELCDVFSFVQLTLCDLESEIERKSLNKILPRNVQ